MKSLFLSSQLRRTMASPANQHSGYSRFCGQEVYAVAGEIPAVVQSPVDLAAVTNEPLEEHLDVDVIAGQDV